MKLRTVAKIGVILSALLFAVGVGVYSFVQLKLADSTQEIDLLKLVPADVRGVVESDDVDFFINELPRMAYAAQFDTLHQSNLIATLFFELTRYSSHSAHGLSNHINQVMISFHQPLTSRDMVAYFRMNKNGKQVLREVLLEKYGTRYAPKKEIYRGKEIRIYPLNTKDFLSFYGEEGYVAVSHEKRLIEKVIDAQLDKQSLSKDTLFKKLHQTKSSRFMTFYGRTAPLPLISEGVDCWSEYDLYMNSKSIYLSGKMVAPDSSLLTVSTRLHGIPAVRKDSLVIVSGEERVDSCITQMMKEAKSELVSKCVSELSHEASYIMVVDMLKVNQEKAFYRNYLPPFLNEWSAMFRYFILSVQVTEVADKFSHIFILTYRD